MKKLLILLLSLLLFSMLTGCNVEYEKDIEDSSEQSDLERLREEEARETGYSFLFLSDTAKAEGGDYSKLKTMMDYAASGLPAASFVLHAGDVVNPSEDGAEWTEYQEATAALGDIPTYVSWGEKDDDSLLSQFSLPENGPTDLLHHFYSFDYEDAHFVFLDSAYMGLQREDYTNWLRSDLESNGKKWNILVCHYSLYPACDLDHDIDRAEAQRKLWDALLCDLDIDLVLSGHQHVYARSYPVQGGEKADDGPIYVQVNSGGICNANTADYEYTETAYIETSTFCHFKITPTDLNMTVYDENLQQVDSLTIRK